jgi:hypothetical protein
MQVKPLCLCIFFIMCLKYYEVYTWSHRDCVGIYTCGNLCTPIIHIDYIGIKCVDCQEADIAEATGKSEEEKNALAFVERSKQTEEEY